MNTTVQSEILVVDDKPDNLRLMSEVLEHEGYRVRVAPGGELALKSVSARLPALILLDIKMPDLDGLEVCRRLKADPMTADIPIIFLSALREHEDKLRGFEAGAVDYITKPFIAEEVLARVRTHLTLRNMQQLLEQQVSDRTRALRTLSAGNQAVVHAQDEEGLLKAMCQAIVDAGGYRAAWVALENGRTYQYGGNPQTAACDYAALLDQAISIDGPTLLLPQHKPATLPLCACGARAALFQNIYKGQQRLGHLLVFADELVSFSQPQDIQLLQEMAGDLGYGITTLRTRLAHQDSRRRLERSFAQTIEALAATIEVRDPYTAGHQQRTTAIAEAIAKRLGLDQDRLRGLFIAGTVHDIGKISVPTSILSKPGKLDELEFALIQKHSQTGYEILRGIEFPWPVAEIVHQHHERLDGSGYPRGLKGDDILLEARILAVADVLEAISSHRPYRPSLGIDFALEELKKQAGDKLDSQVVETCLALATSGELSSLVQ